MPMPGVFVVKRVTGSGLPIARIPAGDALLVIDAFGPDRKEIAASVEGVAWQSLAPWWQAALSDANVGDRRTVWFCSDESKKEWKELAGQECVATDLELITLSGSTVPAPRPSNGAAKRWPQSTAEST